MDKDIRARAAALFNSLSHPTRLRIVELIGNSHKTVNEVASALELPQPLVSQHLAILTRAGVLAVEPKGSSRIYRVRGPRVGQVMRLIEEFCSIHGLHGEVDAIGIEEGHHGE
jgi:ArsR family transcriptional regulator